MIIQAIMHFLKLFFSQGSSKDLIYNLCFETIQYISCNDSSSKKSDIYLILENCMVYNKKMSADYFKAYYFSRFSTESHIFFPLSDYPTYLDRRNFNETVTLKHISISVLSTQQNREPTIQQYEDCSLGVNEGDNCTHIGIKFSFQMKEDLLKFINREDESEIKINIKVAEEFEEFSIMNIISTRDHITISTIPILDHFLSEETLSYSPFHLDKLRKYQMIHYLHALSRLNEEENLQIVQEADKLNIRKVVVNCHTPVFLFRLNNVRKDSFEKQVTSILDKPTTPLLLHHSPEYDRLAWETPRTAINFCYKTNPYLCEVYNISFSESICPDKTTSHTVLFNFTGNKTEYSSSVEKSKFCLLKSLDGNRTIYVSKDSKTNLNNVNPGDFRRFQTEMSPSFCDTEMLELHYYVNESEKGDFYVSIDVPSTSATKQSFSNTRLQKLLRKGNGMFSLTLYYESETKCVKTMKYDTYLICLDFDKIYYIHTKQVILLINTTPDAGKVSNCLNYII
ncbi:hypothetical protein CDIK_1285 [Cucumispora dikerogammari]|nr:hypothetical protein CDIK_1285 [Cucumispora dikerogammari]